MNLIDMKHEQRAALKKAEEIVSRMEADAAAGKTVTALAENSDYVSAMDRYKTLGQLVAAREAQNTIRATFRMAEGGIPGLVDVPSGGQALRTDARPEHPMGAEFRQRFAAWVNSTLTSLGGGPPQMEATAPSGPLSVGTGSGVDSVGLLVPTAVLPYLPSYYALDSFGLAGASVFYTDHTRPLVKPILSAGAADAVIAENAAPTTSQPFGLSSFTFGGTKYGRLVLASYEALMNSEIPLQGAILDELLAALANTLTTATTQAFVTAITGGSLSVGVGGSGGSVYTSMVDLRHAIPPRFDLPTNKWMLSRATLAAIRNTRANTSGVPMFSPDGGLLFDRPFVINDALDTATGAGVGFVAFGDWASGAFLRRTGIQTRVFLELFASQGQIGYRTQQWADQHFLAELAGTAQPPTFQPLYYTNVASES